MNQGYKFMIAMKEICKKVFSKGLKTRYGARQRLKNIMFHYDKYNVNKGIHITYEQKVKPITSK